MFQATGSIIDRYENRQKTRVEEKLDWAGSRNEMFARYCNKGQEYLYVLTMVCVRTCPLATLGILICSITDVNNSLWVNIIPLPTRQSVYVRVALLDLLGQSSQSLTKCSKLLFTQGTLDFDRTYIEYDPFHFNGCLIHYVYSLYYSV